MNIKKQTNKILKTKEIIKPEVFKKEKIKKIVVEEPIIVKPMVAVKSIATKPKEVKPTTRVIKPIFSIEPIEEIIYSWDLENIEINNFTNVITQITYEFIGIYKDQKYSLMGTLLIPEAKSNAHKIITKDYRHLIKQEILDYIIENVSERQVEAMKSLIVQNLKGTKIISKIFWD